MGDSKKSIIEGARKLFSEFDFLGVSMADIAGSLGITKAALYYHFESKKQLYLEVLKRAFRDLVKNLNEGTKREGNPLKQLSILIQNYLSFSFKEKNIIKSQTLKIKDMDPEIKDFIAKLREKLKRYFKSPLEKILESSKKEISLDSLTSFVLGAMDRLILEAAFLDKKLNAKKRARQILKAIGFI